MNLWSFIIFYIVLPITTFGWGLRAWVQNGRDPKGRGLIIPEYGSPDGLSAAEVGVLYDYQSAEREVTATLIDLTIRGYISITQMTNTGATGSSFTYVFQLLRDDVLNLKSHEQDLLDGLFGVYSAQETGRIQRSVTSIKAKQEINQQYPANTVSLIGKQVSLYDVQPYFYKKVFKMHESLYESLTNSGYFLHNPLMSSIGMSFAGLVLLIFAVLIRGPYGLSLCLAAIPLIFFTILMKARTKKGQLSKDYIDGFRLYLQTAETEQINMLQGPHSKPAKDTSQVELYEHFLPYAISLGLENEWTEQFSSIYKEPIGWLKGPEQSPSINTITDMSSAIKDHLANNLA